MTFLNVSEESWLLAVLIPDGSGEQSVRDVIAFPDDGVIRSLSVSVSITHPYRGDLRVTLISPSGPERVFSMTFLNVSEETRLLAVLIPDGSGEQSVRDVIAFPDDGVIRSLSVSVSITHPYRGDLRVTLISPSGPERVFSMTFLNVSEETRLLAVLIPDGSGEQSVRDVIAFPVDGVIRSLSVSVSITHPYRGDLRVTLISPSGREVVLYDRTEGLVRNLRRTCNDGNLPALADLLGTNPLGDWTLTVGDYQGDDIGTLDEWSLRMTIDADRRRLSGG